MKLLAAFLIIASASAQEGARSLFSVPEGTRRGTESIEVLGGVNWDHPRARTDAQATLRLRGGISRALSGWFDFSHSTTRNDFVNSVTVKESIQFIGAGVQVHAPLGRVEPYLIGGLGTMRFAASVRGQSADAFRFAQTAGAGVRFGVTHWIGLSVEARGIHVQDRGWISQYGVGAWTAIGGR